MTFSLWLGGSSDFALHFNGGESDSTPHARAYYRERKAERAANDSNDLSLLERIRNSDETALMALIQTHTTPLTRFAYEFVGSYDSAEDIVDDVFVWVWEHRANLDIHGTVRSYLYGATRHRSLNARRNAEYREKWSARHSNNPVDTGMGQASRDIASQLEADELGELLHRAINTLAEGRRTAVLLRWIEDMSYAEIAESMGTSVVAVKLQLNRALHDLRKKLPGYLK